MRCVVDSWPRGYLFADQVGLGKTIEAGFVIRELLLSGKAETFLLLVPAAVLRQWQEELAEKLNLRVNRFEDGEFYDPAGNAVPWNGSPWSAFPIVLASSHLARRRDRRREVLASGPWDVVLLDEAHHARRKGKEINASPNAMLQLLDEIVRGQLCQALLLATATPMQMYPARPGTSSGCSGSPASGGSRHRCSSATSSSSTLTSRSTTGRSCRKWRKTAPRTPKRHWTRPLSTKSPGSASPLGAEWSLALPRGE